MIARYEKAMILAKGGASLRGILLYPLRHRLATPRNQIDLKTGLSIVSPMEEPLIYLFEEIWVGHAYTPPDFNVEPGDTVVDIGANIGVFSMWAAARAQRVRVISLEPSPGMFHCLQQNLSRNGLHQVIAVQAACGGHNGTAVLYSRGFEGGNSLYSRDIAGSVFRPLTRVEVLTLDEVFRRYQVETCSLLKLDCEGAEYEILFKASEATLRNVRRVSMEYHLGLNDHCLEEMVVFLEEQDFGVTYTPPYDEECGYLYASRQV